MNRKVIFIQGMILIVITIVINIILANQIFSERIIEVNKGQASLVRSIDHIFTALTYLEKTSQSQLSAGFKDEMDKARETLRSPELIKIRREVEGK